jgi:hypothetical protein
MMRDASDASISQGKQGQERITIKGSARSMHNGLTIGLGRLSSLHPAMKIALGAVVTVVVAAIAFFYFPQRPTVDLFYTHTAENNSFFQAQNRSPFTKEITVKSFAISTARFGTIGYDKFDEDLADNHSVVAGYDLKSITVPAATDTEPYLCSQLRSVGFFLNYGKVEHGKLPQISTPDRAQQIANDLSCSFTVSEASPGAVPVNYTQSVECSRVSWVSDCVSSVLSSPN